MDPTKPNTSDLAQSTYSSMFSDEDADYTEGLATTREQISDVYMAGTSDGISFLGNGVQRVLPKGEDQATLE